MEEIEDANENVEERSSPKDKWNYVLFLFTLLGISGLLPWNLFITANEYFLFKFGDNKTSDSNGTNKNYYQNNFQNYFTVTGSLFAFLGNILNVYLTSKFSGRWRIILGHILVVTSFVPTFIFAFVETTTWVLPYFLLTLLVIIVGQIACSGLICGGAAGLAALYPHRYMKAFITGQAICGVFTSLVNIVSLAIGSKSPVEAGQVYFSIAILFTLLSLTVYYPSKNNAYVKFHHLHNARKISINNSDEDNQPLLADPSQPVVTAVSGQFSTAVFWKTIYYGSLLVSVFLVTLSCFPALTAKVESTSSKVVWKKYFTPVACFLLVNSFDFIGRVLVSFFTWPSANSGILSVICFLRVGFIPLFLLCNFSSKYYFPLTFYSDWWFAIFASLLGLTNGYLCNLLCVYLPKRLPVEEKEIAGTLVATYINLGVFLGSCLSFGIVKLI